MKKIAFITLKTFSGVGGIEQFNKYVTKCLQELADSHQYQVKVFSVYDDKADAAIIDATHFKGYKQRKIFAVLDIIRQVRGFDIVILGHILLWPIGEILNLVSKNTKWYFFAHGIEVWNDIPARQKSALQKCTGILSVSQFTADTLINKQGVDANKVTLFYNAVDKERLQNANENLLQELRIKYNIRTEETVFITVSRMSEKERGKGYPLVIKAMGELVKQGKEVRHLLIGTVTPEEKVYINHLIEDNQLADHIILTGYVSDDNLPAYYALADVFVMPSKKEGFGIVYIEAAWYGLQVIAGNEDGSKEAVLNGKMGILVNPHLQEEIYNAMLSSIGFKKNLQKTDYNRRLIDEHFSLEKMRRRLEDLIEKV